MEKNLLKFYLLSTLTQSLYLKKIHSFHNNTEKTTTKLNKHTACGYSIFTQCSFESNRNISDYYSSKDCMKNICKDLREHVIKITNFERLKMLLLTEKENKSHF